ncbi:MAG: hypothetical protein Q3961_04060 [Bifidobacteriaceae bacterium]|nr:hypothetical protein [Bifidobacteriaceae bacterium]
MNVENNLHVEDDNFDEIIYSSESSNAINSAIIGKKTRIIVSIIIPIILILISAIQIAALFLPNMHIKGYGDVTYFSAQNSNTTIPKYNDGYLLILANGIIIIASLIALIGRGLIYRILPLYVIVEAILVFFIYYKTVSEVSFLVYGGYTMSIGLGMHLILVTGILYMIVGIFSLCIQAFSRFKRKQI